MKRSISKTFRTSPELGGFCGWRRLQEVWGTLEGDSLAIMIGLFTLGCRAGELRQVSTNQIHLDYSQHQVEVRSMYVSKWRREKVSPNYRTFHLNKSEPAYLYLEEQIENTPRGESMFPFSYNQIYYRIALIENTLDKTRGDRSSDWVNHKGPWWPHRVRADRACQLIKDYSFTSYALKKWFGWVSDEQPNLYGSMSNLDVARLMLKPAQTLHVTPEKLSDMSDDQRQFIIELLREQ